MQNVSVAPGVYVVAVSGGVDSVVLLDILAQQPDLQLTVAHFDHGIRSDSAEDRQLVAELAAHHKLPYIYETAHLGPTASEQVARDARYKFLQDARVKANARAIITAHHKDDVLETAIHNIGRGTGRLGLASLGSNADIVRPLLGVTKVEIRAYAQAHNLTWREDSTNSNDAYRRNYIRHQVLPRFSAADKEQLAQRIETARSLNSEINELIDEFLTAHEGPQGLNRRAFTVLDDRTAREVMASWLRSKNIRGFDKKAIERLTHAAKTFHAGKVADVSGGWVVEVSRDYLALTHRER